MRVPSWVFLVLGCGTASQASESVCDKDPSIQQLNHASSILL